MSSFTHLVAIAGYAGLAGSIALILPRTVPMPPDLAYVVGACLFLAAALMHEILARRSETQELAEDVTSAWQVQAEEVDRLLHQNRLLAEDLLLARHELSDLRERFEEARATGSEKLIAEMKVLQQQLAHFAGRAGRTGKRAHAATRPAAGLTEEAPALPPVSEALDDDAVVEIAREALENNRVDLYLQPVVSLPQRKTRYYEAFSRIRTQDQRLILPERYLPLIAERGLLPVVDNLLLFRCVQLIRRVKKRRLNVGFFVNIASASLTDPEFLQQFTDFLNGNREMTDCLFFEFAHADVEAHWPVLSPLLARLASMGFHFSLDQVAHLDLDLEWLARRHFRFIKVPASLLLADASDSGARVHPMDLKEVLKRNEIDLIVDQVEEEAQLVELLDLSVDFGQGFLFGAPRLSRDETALPHR